MEVFNVLSNPSVSRIINISTRGLVKTGSASMIAGFVISGGNKEVMIRVSGPSLAAYNVSGTVSNPELWLYKVETSGNRLIGVNRDRNLAWNQSAIASETARVYAFPQTSNQDAAMLKVLAPGTYTAVANTENGTDGIGLLEVYDVNAY